MGDAIHQLRVGLLVPGDRTPDETVKWLIAALKAAGVQGCGVEFLSSLPTATPDPRIVTVTRWDPNTPVDIIRNPPRPDDPPR